MPVKVYRPQPAGNNNYLTSPIFVRDSQVMTVPLQYRYGNHLCCLKLAYTSVLNFQHA